MPTGTRGPRFAVRFDEVALGEDLEHASAAGRRAAERAPRARARGRPRRPAAALPVAGARRHTTRRLREDAGAMARRPMGNRARPRRGEHCAIPAGAALRGAPPGGARAPERLPGPPPPPARRLTPRAPAFTPPADRSRAAVRLPNLRA